MTEILKTVANSFMQAGLAAALIGGLCALYMLFRAVKRTKQGRVTKVDALFLSYSAPGFSKFSILNAPDTLGLGVYAALALEQVGAIQDIKPHVEVNLKLYPEWAATYSSAARFCALVGEKQIAKDYLLVSKTLADNQKLTMDIPQIDRAVIETLIASTARLPLSTTSIGAMHEDLRKRPYLLILARSVLVLFLGLGLLFMGVLLLIVRNFIS